MTQTDYISQEKKDEEDSSAFKITLVYRYDCWKTTKFTPTGSNADSTGINRTIIIRT